MNVIILVAVSAIIGFLYAHSFVIQQKSAALSKKNLYLRIIVLNGIKIIALPCACYYLLLLPLLKSIILLGFFLAAFWLVILINIFLYEKS